MTFWVLIWMMSSASNLIFRLRTVQGQFTAKFTRDITQRSE